jgi:hypothetical protein
MKSTIQSSKSKTDTRRGRRVGSTIFSSDSFLEDAIRAYRKCASRKLDERCTQYDVSEGLGIARATLNRYCETFGISWAQIRRSAMILPYELEDSF